jgi:putative SOS response-associated peptidase YedK
LCRRLTFSSSPGRKSPKSKWKFTRPGEDWFCFAGLWRPMPGGAGEAFTLLTTEPGPDVAPIHDRQMVILDRADWAAWLKRNCCGHCLRVRSQSSRCARSNSGASGSLRYP